MQRRVFFFTLLFPFVSGCDEDEDKALAGSGVESKKSRNVPAFKRLWVGGTLHVTVTVGGEGPMEIRGDDNLLDHVTSRLENGELKLNTDVKVRTKMPLELKLSAAELEAVTAVGAARVEIQGLKAKKLEVRAGGAGRVTAAGTAEELAVGANGAAQVDLSAIAAASATVKLEKAAMAKFGYLEKLDATAAGASRVIYRGDPQITNKVTRPARLVRSEN